MRLILFLCKGSLDEAVPIISIAQALNSYGNLIEIVCSNISRGLREELEGSGIKVFPLGINEPSSNNPVIKIGQKLYHWLAFRRKTKIMLYKKNPCLLYIATADTAIALRGIYNNYIYILHLRELHNKQPYYMMLIRKPAQKASRVVVPEENRAYLYYNFFKLKKVPAVIPNRPFYHPMQTRMDISFLEPEVQRMLRSKKNIIYQGHLHKERNLTSLIKASLKLKEFNIILMGKNWGMLDKYIKINPDIIYIPFIRPPLYLNITSWAYIGVITYDLSSLNTIYCAPNKVWEFAGFSIPVLGNINPGIKYSVGNANAGVIVNFENENEILRGIQQIDENYQYYQSNANDLYNAPEISKVYLMI